MANHEHLDEHLNPQEITFITLMQSGDSYFQIELFKSARNSYKHALEVMPGNVSATDKIAECTTRIATDTRRVLFILPIYLAAVVTLIYYAFQ